MADGTRAARKTAYLILAALLYLYFRGIGDHGLLDPVEGTNASVALSMAVGKNFAAPMVDGRPYIGNSMGFWWLSALSLSFWGWNEFAVRLWPVLGGLGMAAAGWFIALRTGGERAANYAAVLIGSSLLVYVTSQLASPHALYACLVTTCLLGAVYAFRNERFFILLHASAALAFVVYGPAGLLLPWLALLAYAVAAEQERFFARALFYWPGLLVTILIGGGYIAYLQIKNPYILTLMLHNIPSEMFNSAASAAVVTAMGFFPWLGALPGAVKSALPLRWKYILPSEKQNVLFISWCAVFFFFGAFSRDALLLAAGFPALGVICANYLAQAVERKDTRLLRKFVALEILLAVPVLFVGLPFFYMTFGNGMRYTLMSVIPWGVLCLLFLFAGWRYARTRQIRKLILHMSALSLLSLLPLAGVFDLLGARFSVRDIGLHIRNIAKPDDLLVQYALNQPSLSFYVGKTGTLLAHAPLNWKIAGQSLADDAYLDKIWRDDKRIFLLIGRYQEIMSPLPRVVYNLYETRDKIVLSNRSDAELTATPPD